MKEIVYISDYFYGEINGGAESVDRCLIQHLEGQGYKITRKNSRDVVKISQGKKYIISNFVELPLHIIEEFSKKDYFYLIQEHDHKYCALRDPLQYNKQGLVPASEVRNLRFYHSANAVLCQSKMHADSLKKNLLLKNIVNLGCSLWSEDEISILQKCLKNKKEKKNAIIKSNNKIKGTNLAVRFCESNNLSYELISSPNYKTFIDKLSKFEKLTFFPQTMETFCRLIVEARILNCELITNGNNGCTSEEWFSQYKGQDLLDFIEKEGKSVCSRIEKILNEDCDEFLENELPKVSIVTSMFGGLDNLESFIQDVVGQIYFKFSEWVIIDVDPNPQKKSIINKYVKKFDNIKYQELEGDDPGVYGCWNLAIKNSSGEFITNANLDDRRSEGQILLFVRDLLQNDNYDLVYSENFVTHVENENFKKNSSKGLVYPVTSFSKENMIKCLPGPNPVWRRSVHDSCGYFNENYKFAGDWEFWLRLVRNNSVFGKVPGVHGLYHLNPSGLSTNEKFSKERFEEEKSVFWEYIDIFGIDNVEKFSNFFSQ
jgi:hypothetical protein